MRQTRACNWDCHSFALFQHATHDCTKSTKKTKQTFNSVRAPVQPDAREPFAQRDTTSTVVRFHLPLSLLVASFYPSSSSFSHPLSHLLVYTYSLLTSFFFSLRWSFLIFLFLRFVEFLPVNTQRNSIKALRWSVKYTKIYKIQIITILKIIYIYIIYTNH